MQQVGIKPIIVAAEKESRPTVVPLGDGLGQVRDHPARQTRHRRMVKAKV